MALQPGNTSFVPGDLLTAQQYNITHNTVNKLAIEDNSRVVYPGSFPPANIASGHWVIAALAGNYSNYPGITSTSVLSPSVLVYDSSINEWDVYPLSGIGESTISIYNPSVQYKINDIVIYNDIDSVLPEYRYEYIYRCKEIAFPDQSPESTPSKWVRQGLYIDMDAITALITSLDSRLTSVEIELTNKVNTSLLGANNGVATLDNQGKILTSQLPSLLINNTYVVNSEAEMLALTAIKSDIAVRLDVEKTFILAEEPASNINNWIEVLASYDRVISVNGLGGIVTLTTSDIPEGSNLYFSDSRVDNNTNVAANTAKRHDQVTIGTPNGLLLNGQELSLQKASITETGALSSEDWLTFNNKQDIILQGPVDSYYRGDKTWKTLNTTSVVESTNLYFTESRVLNTSIGNFIEIDVAITAGDSIATALNKLQTQVNNRIATVSKEQIEAALTGNITSHTHDIYLTDAPIDGKNYARKDGSWSEFVAEPPIAEHDQLTLASRQLPDQHPISSITGLSTQLTAIENNLASEIITRGQEDSNIRLDLSTETSNRESADFAITEEINNINIVNNTQSQDILDLQNDTQKLSTGWVSGMLLTINTTDNTKVDISSGVFIIADYTNPLIPNITKVNFPGAVGVTPQYLTTANLSYIAVDVNNAIIQSHDPFTCAQRRQYCLIGAAVHSNKINVNVVNQIKNPAIEGVSQLHDLICFVGPVNDGNVFTANGANLQINKASGSIFKMGSNPDNNNPHTTFLPQLTSAQFRYRLRTGTEYTDVININPTQWDNNGVLSTVPNNKFTVQVIALFQSNVVRIQYGQKIYDSLSAAQIGLSSDPFTLEENIEENAILRCYLIIKKEVTNLTTAISVGNALFVNVGKFGELASGSATGIVSGSTGTNIYPATAWDGTSFAVPMSELAIYKRTVNNGVNSLSFSLLFPLDSSNISRHVSVVVDNSANTTAISAITFSGGTWNWDVGVQPSGLAAGATATLELYNESDTSVKPNWTVKA